MADQTHAPGAATYFTQIAPGTYRANDASRGPWSPEHCHAGPVAGLIVRALEQAVPGKMLTRLTMNLVRAVPMAGVQVMAEVGHAGRSVATASATLTDLDGKVCCTATSMHLVTDTVPEMPTAPVAPLTRTGATDGARPLPGGLWDKPMFGDFVQMSYGAGSSPGAGPKTVWMKAPPLMEGEATSPIQAICPLADCGNALSRNAEFQDMTFMNTDLTLHVHRAPQGDWFASETLSHWQPTGIGLSQAILHDEHGPVAVALQSLMLRPPKR